MLSRPLTIIHRGAFSYTICVRCNSRLESKYLDMLRAGEEIRRKHESHVCQQVEVSVPLPDEPSKTLALRPWLIGK
jgi:hypothetical protein